MSSVHDTPPPDQSDSLSLRRSVPEARRRRNVSNESSVDSVAGRVIVPQDVQGTMRRERQILKLKKASKGLWDWLASFFPATPSRTVANLVKSFAEHRQMDVQNFARHLLTGNFEGLTRVSLPEIVRILREDYGAIKKLLGPELAKQFLYHIIGVDCAANPNNKVAWDAFIAKEYGPNGASTILKSHLIGRLENHIRDNSNVDASGCLQFLGQLMSEARRSQHPLQEALQITDFIQEVHAAAVRATNEKKKFLATARAVSALAESGFVSRASERSLHRTEKILVRQAVTLDTFADELSRFVGNWYEGNVEFDSSQVRLLKQVFGPTPQVPDTLRRGSQRIFDAGALLFRDQAFRQDWFRVAGKASQSPSRNTLVEETPSSFLRDCIGAGYHIGGKRIHSPLRDASVQDSRLPIASDPVIRNTVNDEFRHFLQSALAARGKRCDAAAVNLLRYQIQDIATQGLFVLSPEFFERMFLEYQEKGCHLGTYSQSEGKGLNFYFAIEGDMLTIKAVRTFGVHTNPSNPPIGFDAMRMTVAIDLRTFNPSLPLLSQEEGCIRGECMRVGFRENWADVEHFS